MSGETLARKFVRPFSSSSESLNPGISKRHDLQPKTHLVQAPDGFENRPDSPAELVIVAIVEALEVNLVEINPRSNIFQHLGRTVAV